METRSGENSKMFSGPFPTENNGKNRKSDFFNAGRGNVSADVAKSVSSLLKRGATEVNIGVGQDGTMANDGGAKPISATGAHPFHTGQGPGRGR